MPIKNYGLPYKGSKNRIAKDIVEFLPAADTLIDLMCGGCAITHAALESNKWKNIVANDINIQIPQLFVRAVKGEFSGCDRWVSREEFMENKGKDAFVRLVYSFGNNGRTYMYAKELEPYKRALHRVVFWNDWEEFVFLMPEVADYCKVALAGIKDTSERRKAIGRAIPKAMWATQDGSIIGKNPLYRQVKFKGDKQRDKLQALQSLECLERLQSLERLKSLESSERLERLKCMQSPLVNTISVTGLDYADVLIPVGATVYADKPYSTKYREQDYGKGFDHNRFWQWARDVSLPVFVSEYAAPDDFVSVWRKNKTVNINANKTTIATEHIFLHRRWCANGRPIITQQHINQYPKAMTATEQDLFPTYDRNI